MGANQSTRKLTVVSDEATGVVKISDSVLERLKGEISGEKKETSPPPLPPPPQPEPQPEPEAAAPPEPPAPAPVQPPVEEVPPPPPVVAPPVAPAPAPAPAPVAPPVVEHIQSQGPINIIISFNNSLGPVQLITFNGKRK